MSSGASAFASKSTESFEPGFILKASYFPRARTVGVTPEGGDAIEMDAKVMSPMTKLTAAKPFRRRPQVGPDTRLIPPIDRHKLPDVRPGPLHRGRTWRERATNRA